MVLTEVGRRTDLDFPYGFLTPKLTSRGLESDRECVGYASETLYTRYGTCEYGSRFLNNPSTTLARSFSAQNIPCTAQYEKVGERSYKQQR